ncbi:MAG: universal stress protein [Pseudomonadota bacterium]
MSITAMFLSKTEDDGAALRFAAEVAHLTGQSLKAICPLPDPSNVYAYSTPEFAIGVSTVLSKQMKEEQELLRNQSGSVFESVVSRSSLPEDRSELRIVTGIPMEIAAREAVLSDALMFPRAASVGGHAFSGALEHVMMDCALPVIISGSKPRTDGPVIVAWDASDQAARSLKMHLPVFRHVGPVMIAQSEDGVKQRGDASSPDAVVRWLSSHGVESSAETIRGPVAKGLLDLSEQKSAAMIVAGAYGHSRAGQYLFGGVTRTLLRAESAPALALCH